MSIWQLGDGLQQALANHQLGLAVGVAWVAGVLTSLSPCVYPLIPVTLTALGVRHPDKASEQKKEPCEGKAKGHSPQKRRQSPHAVGKALVYVLGMVLLFCTLGVLAASAGRFLGAALQQPWFLFALAGFFCAMACGLLGVFDLVLPQGILLRLSQVGGSGYKGAFFMGLVAGLIAAPCSGPVLAGILALIAHSADRVTGTLLMASYALGMGTPLLVLGIFANTLVHRLPKSGSWMLKVKAVLAVGLLLLSLFYIQLAWGALADALENLAVASPVIILLLTVLGISLMAETPTDVITMKSKNYAVASKLAGACLTAVGLWVGATWVNIWAAPVVPNTLSWRVVTAGDNASDRMQQALAAAKAANKPVLLKFSADWCAWCKKLDRRTLVNKQVQEVLANFVIIKVDVTRSHPQLHILRQRYEAIGLPTLVVLDAQTQTVQNRLRGFVSAGRLLRALR